MARCSSPSPPGCCCAPGRQLDLRGRRRRSTAPARSACRSSHTKIGLFMTASASSPGSSACILAVHVQHRAVRRGRRQGVHLHHRAPSIGGCLLTGGYGSAVGAAFGAFIFGMVNQGIVYAGWNTDWFKAFLGVDAARRRPASTAGSAARRRRQMSMTDRRNDHRRRRVARATTPHRRVPRSSRSRTSASPTATSSRCAASTSVRAGEVTCVLGDNGAGKSTLIKIICRARTSTPRASFVVDGEPVQLQLAARGARHWASRPSTRTSPWCR